MNSTGLTLSSKNSMSTFPKHTEHQFFDMSSAAVPNQNTTIMEPPKSTEAPTVHNGTTTIGRPSNGSDLIITLGSTLIASQNGSGIVIGGSTLTPGGPAVTQG